MRVLIVEDEERLARLIRKGLLEEGQAADIAESGEAALAWLAVAPYDAIVLD
ncbi:MAG: DNA-binding response regulator, partial [Thermomicrobiaceae bacterium]|nr:DNA-binding response regulator [Thermomicrobiaceae bacterium]